MRWDHYNYGATLLEGLIIFSKQKQIFNLYTKTVRYNNVQVLMNSVISICICKNKLETIITYTFT